MESKHLQAVGQGDKSGAVELTAAHTNALKARSDSGEVCIGDSIVPGLYLRRDG